MDCVNARLFMTLAGRRPDQLDAPDRDALQAHLDGCSDCAALAQADRALDKALARTMNAVTVPASLQEQLHAAVGRHRPRPLPWVAAAAALLLGLAYGGYWWSTRPTDIPVDRLSYVVVQHSRSPHEAEAYYHEMGLAFVWPQEFHAEYFATFDIAEIKGRRVPRLMFLGPGDGSQRGMPAYVYVLPAAQFRTAPERFIPTSNQTVEVMHGPPGFTYVVVYPAGASLGGILVRPTI